MTNKPTDEEVVMALRKAAETGTDNPMMHGSRYSQYDYAADLLESTLARNAELEKQLTETQRQLRAAVEWGAGLIEVNTDAHVTFCAECGFPIADYGVDKEIFCTMCKSKNTSYNYVPTGPGSCKTTCDRKAKVYDKLFRRGGPDAGEGEQDEPKNYSLLP